MVCRIRSDKIKSIAVEYYANGRNKSKALKAVGYSTNYAEHGGLKLFEDDRIIDALAKIEAKTAARSDVNIDYIQSEHKRLAVLCEQRRDFVNATRNLEGLGKTIGAYQEVTKDITDQQRLLDEKEKAEATRIAQIRLHQGQDNTKKETA